MNKFVLSILIFAFSCSSNDKDIGIEIYEAKIDIKNVVSLYNKECSHCFDIEKTLIVNKPIFNKNDIKKFDFENQTIHLTQEGIEKLKKISIPLWGKPMVLKLNGERIYGFWFWNVMSSYLCDRVYTYPKLGFKLEFGNPYSDISYGEDPRYDGRLKKYFEKD